MPGMILSINKAHFKCIHCFLRDETELNIIVYASYSAAFYAGVRFWC